MAGLAVWVVVDSTPVIFEPAMNSTFTGEVRHEFTGSRMIGSGRRWLRAMILAAGFALGCAAVAAPVISATSDTRQVLAPGQALALSVTATGSGTLSYQWYHDNRTIAGATSASVAVAQAGYSDGGAYTVAVTDSTGTSMSAPMFVIVAPTKTQVLGWGVSSLSGYSTQTILDSSFAKGIDDAVALAADLDYVIVLRRDGTLTFLGYGRYPSVPTGLTGVVAIADGAGWGLALKQDGTVVALGSKAPTVPAGLSGVVAIAAAGTDGYALKSDGTVAWFSTISASTGQPPSGLSHVEAIAAAGAYSGTYAMALESDGSVVSWGKAPGGASVPSEAAAGVVAIAASPSHALALKTDGSVVAWGDGTESDTTVPAGLAGVTALGAGPSFSVVLKSDGTLQSWGAMAQRWIPTAASQVFAIAAGPTYGVAVRDSSSDSTPQIVAQPLGVVAQTDQTATLSVTASGEGLSYQWMKDGLAVDGATASTVTFQAEAALAGDWSVVVSNSAGSATSTAAQVSLVTLAAPAGGMAASQVVHPGDTIHLGVVPVGGSSLTYQWSKNGQDIAGATGSSFERASASYADTGAYAVWVSDGVRRQRLVFYVRVAPASSGIYLYGPQLYGHQVDAWAPPADLFGTVSAIPGLALVADGSLYTWSTMWLVGKPPATRVPGLSDVVALGGDDEVLRSNGSVVYWNGHYPTLDELPAPPCLASIIALSQQGGTTLALKADGTVVAWGENSHGQCDVPAGLTGVVAVSEGEGFSVALKGDGTIALWGDMSGSVGQFPLGLDNVVAVSTGYQAVMALRSDHTVIDWGAGQSAGPGPAGLGNVEAISTAGGFSAAITSDERLVTWGAVPSWTYIWARPDQPVFEARCAGQLMILLTDGSRETAPTFVIQPSNVTANSGQSAVISGHVNDGGYDIAYQWYKDGVAIPNQQSPSLSFTAVTVEDSGVYTLQASTEAGTVTSNAVRLTVPPVNHLLALSTRCYVGTGDAIGVQGLILKQAAVVLMRAAGPSLANYNVSGVLQKPVLTLYDVNGKALVSDQGWQNAPTYLNGTAEQANGDFGVDYDRTQVATAVQAFTFTSPDDSAIAIRLPAGVYTMQVSGAGGTTGNALVEAYLYSPPGDTATGDRFSAVSTRCHVGTGDSIAIVGLSLARPATMLLRAVGPSLANYQVSGVLAKPTMTVYDGAGNVVATNTGWNADATQAALITQAELQVGEFPLTSPDDSAMLLGLKAGLYTIQVKGADGGSGNALVEAYYLHDGN